MELFELIDEDQPVIEAKIVWARKGRSITKKYRCTFGKRKGRLVANPAQCSKPIDLKKRFVLKRTKAQKGARMARKARFTKDLIQPVKLCKE